MSGAKIKYITVIGQSDSGTFYAVWCISFEVMVSSQTRSDVEFIMERCLLLLLHMSY